MKIIILTGQTCSGKSTLEKALETQFGYIRLRSITTRAPRTGEIDGVHYDFVSVEKFVSTPLLESIRFNDNYYGLPADQLVDPNGVYIAVVEPEGRAQVMNYCFDRKIRCIPVFLTVDPGVFADRFMDRYEREILDSPDPAAVTVDMRKRLKVAVMESQWQPTIDSLQVQFGPDTEQEVLEKIKHLVEM